MEAAEQRNALPPLPPPDRTMWQYGKQLDHYTVEQMWAYAMDAIDKALAKKADQ